jgi:GDPmannose 4,6-dehydratase
MMKNAVVTRITGQDGAYLSELLLSKGYLVFGTYRPSSSQNYWRVKELGIKNHANLRLLEFEDTDLAACQTLLVVTNACEVYNLAGQSSAVASLAEPVSAAIRQSGRATRFFQAGSSELFGHAQQVPQVESTPLYPTSPYGVAKLFAHWATVNYREVFKVFGTCGIFFNHESPLRGPEFVTRKITDSFAKLRLGKLDSIELGNVDARRDWGYAKDYVSGMWAALQADESDAFVFATNQMHTVRDFVTIAGSAAGFDIEWNGVAKDEIGIDRKSGRTVVRVNPNLYRPLEIHQRIGST